MRGPDVMQDTLFSVRSLESYVPTDRPPAQVEPGGERRNAASYNWNKPFSRCAGVQIEPLFNELLKRPCGVRRAVWTDERGDLYWPSTICSSVNPSQILALLRVFLDVRARGGVPVPLMRLTCSSRAAFLGHHAAGRKPEHYPREAGRRSRVS
jgi:hypothetical protein